MRHTETRRRRRARSHSRSISSDSVSDSSSEEESQKSVNGLSNGVKHVTLNGKAERNGEKSTLGDGDVDEVEYEPGMKSGLKQLYSGKVCSPTHLPSNIRSDNTGRP
jgi:hypothetical protein